MKGCSRVTPPPPVAKRPTASVFLSKVATKSPRLRLSAKRGAGANPLRSASISLPGPLSFDKGYLSPGVKAP